MKKKKEVKKFKGIPLTSAKNTLDALLKLFGYRGKHWIKELFTDEEGNYCLIGGLKHIDGPFEMKARQLLEKAVKKQTRYSSIIDFNDDEATTFPLVKKAVLRARELAGKRGKK